MRTVIIDQARMGSTRLPGKVLRQVLGKTLLEYQVERLRRVRGADELVIATTVLERDAPIVALCARLGVACFRGSEDDVLARYHGAAEAYGAEAVVRVTSDCPLVDPAVVDRVIRAFAEAEPRCDYVSNALTWTYPLGMTAEILTFAALDEAHREAEDRAEREHVTLFVYRRPERYRLANVAWTADESHHRWTVDTQEDFELVRRILEALYPGNPTFSLEDALALLHENEAWSEINRDVKQRVP